MGITIHFAGRLRGKVEYLRLIAAAHSFAHDGGYAIQDIHEQNKVLSRVTDDERSWDYEGPVVGVRVDLHPDSEPLFLEFDSDLYVQEYIKTQFAGPAIHATVVEFLRRVEPLFLNLKVIDEAEFWDNNDVALLRQNLARCKVAIEKYAAEHPGCRRQVHTEEGRIVDLVT